MCEVDEIINDNQRYTVSISSYYKEEDTIFYQANIFDTAFPTTYLFPFRYSTLKQVHAKISHQNSVP